MTTREEQERIDEEARRAADETETQALDGLAGRTRDAVSPVAGPTPRRVELDITPEESRGITDSAFGDMSLDDPEPDYHATPATPPVDTNALSEAGSFRDPSDDNQPTTSAAVDYGAAGMRQMQHAIDGGGARDLAQPWGAAGNEETFGMATDDDPVVPGRSSAARDLARDDMEPLGDVARSGARAGQMFAPSGAAENWDERFRRLGVGGDFAAQVPDADGDLPGSESDGDADDLASQMPDASPDTDDTDAIDMLSGKPPRDAARDAAAGALPRLDDGLPSEADIADARDTPVEGFLHSLQNGLLGAIGRPRRDFDARGDALEQQRRTGIERRQTAKGEARAGEATAARQGVLDTRAERQLAQTDRRMDQTDAMNASLMSQRAAQTQHIMTADEISRGDRTRNEDSASDESAAARHAYQLAVDRLPPHLRDALGADTPDGFDQMSAARLERPLRVLERISVGARGTGNAGGGGSSRASLSQVLQREAHMTPEEAEQAIDGLGTRGARSLASSAAGAHARDASAPDSESFVVAAPAGQPEMRLSSAVYSDPVSQRAARASLDGNRQIARAIGNIDAIRQRYGAEVAVPGTAGYGAMSQAQSRLATAQSAISNAGTINAGEREIYIQDGPPGFSIADFITGDDRTYRASLDAWRQTLEGNVRAIAGDGGVPQTDMDRWVQYYTGGLPGGHAPPARRTASGTTPTAGAEASTAGALWTFPDGSRRRITPELEARAREVGARPPGDP